LKIPQKNVQEVVIDTFTTQLLYNFAIDNSLQAIAFCKKIDIIDNMMKSNKIQHWSKNEQ